MRLSLFGYTCLLFAATLANAQREPATPLDVLRTWGNQFKARFCLTAPFDLYGWKFRIMVSTSVQSVQLSTAKLQKLEVMGNGKSKLLFSHQSYNQRWLEGEINCFEFIATCASRLTKSPKGSVKFAGIKKPEVCVPVETGQGLEINITRHWHDGIQGVLCLDVPRHMDGWNIRFNFSKRISGLTTWGAEEDKVNKQIYMLSEVDWNSQLRRGRRHCIGFLVHTKGRFINPCMDAYFVEEDGETPIVPEEVTTTPEPETTTPEIETTTPEIETTTPEIETTTPEVETTTPEVESTTPELESSTPEINLSTTEFNTESTTTFAQESTTAGNDS